jgi:hypothetical protein
MNQLEIRLPIYSPRWGHDVYELSLTPDSLAIASHGRSATCTWRDDHGPQWSGEPLEDILSNDKIYPPSILQELIEHAWTKWRSGALDDQAVEEELNVVADWLNTTTRARPDTDFWRKYF